MYRLACAAFVLMAFLTLPAIAEDWPGFRGVNGSGVSPSKGLPAEFSATRNVRWQVTLGEGIASPVIASGRVFTTAMSGPQKFAVFCHDAVTGKELWKRELETGKLPRITPPNSQASSTPAADDKRVYVYFSTLGLLAFDAASGKDAWKHPLPRPAYLMDWGAGSSPIVHGDSILFCQDDDLLPYLLCLDAATGKQRWKTPRLDMLAGYALPVLCQANSRTDVVVAGTGKLKGYDPETGKEVWSCDTLPRTVMTSPVVKDGIIYVAVQSYGDAKRTLKFALLEWLDTNQDGKLTRAELPKEFHDKFDQSDKNKDGVLSDEEIDTAFQHPSNQVGGGNFVVAVRGGGQGDVTKTHLLWKFDKPAPSNLSSPVATGERLFMVKSGGLTSCFAATSGKPLWERKRIGNLGDYYGSPVAADGKIYVPGRNGFIVVLADAPELKILARNDMAGEVYSSPAIADGRMYIRTRDKLYCISSETR